MTPTDFLSQAAEFLRENRRLSPRSGNLLLVPNNDGSFAWFGIAPDGTKFNPNLNPISNHVALAHIIAAWSERVARAGNAVVYSSSLKGFEVLKGSGVAILYETFEEALLAAVKASIET